MFDAILNWFAQPLSYPFMQQALVTALLVAFVCALLSCYLVLKGWSLMGDAISHAVLPGIVIAFVVGLPLAIGAFISGVLCAVFTGYLKDNSRLKEDTVMGIVFSGMFAFGLVLFTKVETDQHLLHVLFGNLLGVPKQEFILILVISLLTSSIVLLKWKDFLLYCFDPVQAKIAGLPVKLLHYALLMLLALTIVAAMQVVGVILVVALLISPGITAFCLTRRFSQMLLIAILVSSLSTFIGTILSFHIDSATGPTIILVQSLFFVVALILRALRQQKADNVTLTELKQATHKS